MELNKIREMSDKELNAELIKLKKDLFNLRFQHVTGQLENPVKLREIKKDIARVKTIISDFKSGFCLNHIRCLLI